VNLRAYLEKLAPDALREDGRAQVRRRLELKEPPMRLQEKDADGDDHAPNMEAWKAFEEGQ
jgi:hypothetical protein